MKHYYINPTNLALICYDTEKKDLFILERIESVRVMLGGDVRLGDFEGANPSTDTPDRFDQKGGYAGFIRKPKHTVEHYEKAKRKTITCGNCGKPGHQVRTCPVKVATPLTTDAAPADAHDSGQSAQQEE